PDISAHSSVAYEDNVRQRLEDVKASMAQRARRHSTESTRHFRSVFGVVRILTKTFRVPSPTVARTGIGDRSHPWPAPEAMASQRLRGNICGNSATMRAVPHSGWNFHGTPPTDSGYSV